MPHTDNDLETLAALLQDLPVENGGMNVSELDGLVAGVLVCPEMTMPSEWLPLVWGDGIVASFLNERQASLTNTAVMDHYNRVANLLASSPEDYQALLDMEDISGDILWEPWISGFERAMGLRPDSWGDIIESNDDEAAACISMIMALHEINQGTSELPEKTIDEMDGIAPDYLADIVITLNEWTKSRLRAPAKAFQSDNDNIVPFRTTKIGRNDPCPCGSGKKYKKCCGSN